MSRRALWKLSVATSPQSEQALAELMSARFGQSPAIYTDLEKGQTTVAVYLQAKPDWSGTARLDLAQQLQQSKIISNAASAKLTLEKLRPEDWTEAWKRHFKPLDIGNRLRVRPSWSRSRPQRGQVEVILDPGMSFGTGQHPTTGFCLAEVARGYQADQIRSMLDIGTGSGILAIAAAKLGYQPVEALDLDPDSIRVARGNARTNTVSTAIRFKCQDLTAMPLSSARQYSVICANLMAELLQAQKSRILARLQPGGLLVLAGILKSEFAAVQKTYENAGLRLVRSRTQREWRSGSFLCPDA
jgi:ribosomal protein L11 methyltransferase